MTKYCYPYTIHKDGKRVEQGVRLSKVQFDDENVHNALRKEASKKFGEDCVVKIVRSLNKD